MSWSSSAAAVPRQFRASSQPETFSPLHSPISTSSSRKSSGSMPSAARARTESLSTSTASSRPASFTPSGASWKKRKASQAGIDEELDPSTMGIDPRSTSADGGLPQYSSMSDGSPALAANGVPGLTDSPAIPPQARLGPPPLTPGFTYAFENETAAAEAGEEGDGSEEGEDSKKNVVRRKIRIEYIQDKSRRHITFSKRKAGIMKKAYELATLTGTQVLLLVVSETGLVYTFTTGKLQPLVTQPEGKNLIQACLNTRDGEAPSLSSNADIEEPESNPNFQASVPVQGGQVALKAKLPGVRDRRAVGLQGPGGRMIRRASMPQPRVTAPIAPPAPPPVPPLPGAYDAHARLHMHHPFAEPGGLHIAGLTVESAHASPLTGVEGDMSYEPVSPGDPGVMGANHAMAHPSMMPPGGFHFGDHSLEYSHSHHQSPDPSHQYSIHSVPPPLSVYLPHHPMTPGGHPSHAHHFSSPGEPTSPHPGLHARSMVDYNTLTVSPREMNDRYEAYDHVQPQPPLMPGTPGHHSTPLTGPGGGVQQDYFLHPDEEEAK